MTEDHTAMLAAMYQADEQPQDAIDDASGIDRTRRIRVGVVEYEVPTVGYLQQLEQVLTQHGNILQQQRRAVDRLLKLLRSARSLQQNTVHEIDDLRRELNRKISQRDNLP